MIHPDVTFAIFVGFTTDRPIQPDQHFARVIVAAQTDHDACLVAAQMVACNRGVEMVTSTVITDFWM